MPSKEMDQKHVERHRALYEHRQKSLMRKLDGARPGQFWKQAKKLASKIARVGSHGVFCFESESLLASVAPAKTTGKAVKDIAEAYHLRTGQSLRPGF